MSTSIEQRVVQMKFDNKQFESGVAQSMSTLDKFESKLKLKNAADGFNNISKAADKVDLSNLTKQADSAGGKFDALAVIAISALNRITNQAMAAGEKLIKSLSLDQVQAGWSKYEARTASVQTLVNATGKSVQQIEKYMSKLMTYSDETSYGFDDMSTSLATMVSAGGDIEKLIPLLEGFGNAVSFVGKGAAEYKRAVIQLSQAYGAGAMQLQDWKSIEQTLGGAKQLKEVFIQVAEELNKIDKGEVTIGNFNETLKDKWLTTEVMEQGLGRFAEMTERAFQMIDDGIAKNVTEAYAMLAEEVDDYRIRAAKAAQEAKSFNEAIDATADAVSSQWMASFQLIFGNYEEATILWTELTNTLWDLFASSGETRNEVLEVWRAFKGRETMIDAVKAAFNALYTPVKAVGDAINEIFFPGNVTQKGYWLANATKAVKEFFESLTLSGKAAENLKKAIKLLLIPVFALYQVFRVIFTVITNLITLLFALGEAILLLPNKMDKIKAKLREVLGDERYEKIVAALRTIFEKLGVTAGKVGDAIGRMGASISKAFSSKFAGTMEKLTNTLAPIAGWILDKIVQGFEFLANLNYDRILEFGSIGINSLIDGFNKLLGWCSKGASAVVSFFKSFFTVSPKSILDGIVTTVKNLRDGFIEFTKAIGIDKVFAKITETGGRLLEIIISLGQAIWDFVSKLSPAKILIFAFGVSLVWLFSSLSMAIREFSGIGQSLKNVLGSITGLFNTLSDKFRNKPISILQIAYAIGILTVSLIALSQVDSVKLREASLSLLIVMGGMVAMGGMLAGIAAVTGKFKIAANDILKISIAFGSLAAAAALLATALALLNYVDFNGILQKLGVMIALIGMLAAAVAVVSRFMNRVTIPQAAVIVAFAASVNLMVYALKNLSESDISYTHEQVLAIGAVILSMVGLSLAAKGIKLTSGIAMITFAATLTIFTKSLYPLAELDMVKIIDALNNVITIFARLSLAMLLLGNGKGIKDKSSGILKVSLALGILYLAIKYIGQLDEAVIRKGVGAVSAIIILFTLMSLLVRLGDKDNTSKLEGNFLALASAVLILGIAIDYIGHLEEKPVIQGTAVVMLTISLLSVLAACMSGVKKATASVIAISACIGLLLSVIVLMTLIDNYDELFNVVEALAIAFVSLGAMFKLIGQGLNVGKAISTIVVLEAALWSIVAVFNILYYHLEYVDKILTIAEAIGIVMAALGLSVAMINNSTRRSLDIKQVGKTLLTMVSLLGAVTIIFGLLSNVMPNNDIETMVAKATGIGIVMNALALAMQIIKLDTGDADIKDVGRVSLMVAALGAVGTAVTVALSKWANPDKIYDKVLAVSIVIGALSACAGMLSIFAIALKWVNDDASKKMLAFVGAVSVLGLVAAAIEFILGLIKDPTAMMEKTEAFCKVLLTLILAIGIISILAKALEGLSKVGLAAVKGAAWGTAIIVVVVGIVAFLGLILAALSNLIGNIDKVEEVLDRTELILTRLATIVGEFFGNLIGGLVGGAAGTTLDIVGASIAAFGSNLSKFSNNAKDFLEMKLDPTFGTALSNLAKGITDIASASGEYLFNSIFGKEDKPPLVKLADSLIEIAPKFKEFADGINGIPTDTLTAFTACVTSIADLLTAATVDGGFMDLIFDDRVSEFGDGLVAIAEGVAAYATALVGSDVSQETLDMTRLATEALTELSEKLPKEDGWVQKIFGQADFGKFGEQIKTYGECLKSFIKTCKEVEAEYSETAFEQMKQCTEDLITLAGKVPQTGVLIDFLGGHDIGKFGTQIQEFGSGLAGFFMALKDEDGKWLNLHRGVVNDVTYAGDALIALATKVPSADGFISFITGRKDIGTFGTQVGSFGAGLASFFNSIQEAGVDTAKIDLAAHAGDAFVNIANSLDKGNTDSKWFDKSAFEDFAGSLKKLGTGIKDFYDKAKDVKDWNMVDVAVSNIKKIVELGPGINFISENTIGKFNTFLSSLASSGISSFSTTFANGVTDISDSIHANMVKAILSATTKIVNAPTNYDSLIDAIISGIEGREKDVSNRAANIVEIVITSIEGDIDRFENLGELMITSLIDKFSSYNADLKSAAEAIINDALASIYAVIDFRAGIAYTFVNIGKYCIDGFIIGLNSNSSRLSATVTAIGKDVSKKLEVCLGINSPSKRFAEIGMYSMLGLSKGIEDNAQIATKSIVKMGADLLEAIQEFYGIHSPSRLMRDEVGRYIIQGLADGIEEDMSAEEAAAKKAQNIMTAFQEEFNRWSAKMNISDLEFKLWETINTGATEAEKRERELINLQEKAAAQAERYNAALAQYKSVNEIGDEDAIQDAYEALLQEEISLRELTNKIVELNDTIETADWSMKLDTVDAEDKLWQAMNPNATEEETKSHQQEVLDKQLTYQAQLVAEAEELYNNAIDTYGDTAAETQKAYQAYVNTQTELWELANKLTDLLTPKVEEDKYSREDYQEIEKNFNKIVEDYTSLFDSQEELIDFASKVSGLEDYMQYRQDQRLASQNADKAGKIVDEYMSKVEPTVSVNVDANNLFSEFVKTATGTVDGIVGNVQYVNVYNTISTDGVKTTTSGSTSSADLGISASITKQIQEELDEVSGFSFDVEELYANIGGGFIDNLRQGLSRTGDTLISSVSTGFDALKNWLGVGDSGSSADFNSFKDSIKSVGASVMNLFGFGAEEASGTVTESVSNVVGGVVGVLNETPAQAQEIGRMVDEGLAEGIRQNGGIVEMAMHEVAANAINTTRDTLDVHSPSRVYYWIGEMVDQGLANGLIDSANVVKHAVIDVLTDAQNALYDNPFEATITPILDDNITKSRQALSYNGSGDITPEGYRNDDQVWWTDQIASAIQQLNESEEQRRIAEEIAFAEYKQTLDELKSAVRDMADKPAAVNMTQNNYSPESLNASTIYRNTKTALAKASAAASPTGRSLRSN